MSMASDCMYAILLTNQLIALTTEQGLVCSFWLISIQVENISEGFMLLAFRWIQMSQFSNSDLHYKLHI